MSVRRWVNPYTVSLAFVVACCAAVGADDPPSGLLMAAIFLPAWLVVAAVCGIADRL